MFVACVRGEFKICLNEADIIYPQSTAMTTESVICGILCEYFRHTIYQQRILKVSTRMNCDRKVKNLSWRKLIFFPSLMTVLSLSYENRYLIKILISPLRQKPALFVAWYAPLRNPWFALFYAYNCLRRGCLSSSRDRTLLIKKN